ncbi:amidohydrolase family protein [Pontibacillus sp. ALD_SL1]|uniref:metal-dependent hydrolase family protein n=1 Tax=Pontibacillus sp. ALD_SL1 TaxID=2777185 RepID=UPI001A957887|nr:amidohydrolase family protein [Pontibacillus sp. ALD_SL1]QST01053.1 amidohydrolase family protein [Pontibacillus sp. ALD_SL1]
MKLTLIKNGTVIDGTGGEPVKKAILIRDNRIEALGQPSELPEPSDGNVVDAQGGYVLPGLIDTHVHLMFELEDGNDTVEEPFSLKFYKTVHNMKKTLDAGITTVRDCGFTDAGVKDAVQKGLAQGPRMQLSIVPMTITGGHGDKWMLSGIDNSQRSYPGMPDGRCDGVEEVRKKSREILRAGADVLKVHATGGVFSPTDHPEFTQYTEEELRVMVQEGEYRRGTKVMAHAQGAEGIKNAVRAGIHSIEHGIFLDDEAIELMLANGTYLVPTLLAPLSVIEASERSDKIPEYAAQKAKDVYKQHKESIAKAYQAGVKIAMGTDAGVMRHGTNLRELGLMVDAGMSPEDTIKATTKVAAECMGWGDELGTLEEGKLADLIVTKTNPLKNVRNLEKQENIAFVMKDGKVEKDRLKKPVRV